jgi:hypothetical protein
MAKWLKAIDCKSAEVFYKFICLGIGQKMLILGSSKFGVMLGFFSYENLWDSVSEGVKQCHKESVDAQ